MSDRAPHGKGRLNASRAGAIACDVLDAWFDPSPRAVKAYARTGLSMRTSPDVDGQPLFEAISRGRGLPESSLSLGAGSSELIHRVLPTLMGAGPAVVLDPTYSEYPHLLEREGLDLRRVPVTPETKFRAPLLHLLKACEGASLVVLVNPNSPTGMAMTRAEVLELHSSLAKDAVLWVDETYVDFAPTETSVESDATQRDGLFVLKSLSKAYALSGVRAAYLVGAPTAMAGIVARTPPWIIGTAAMAAAFAALGDTAYYAARWKETTDLAARVASALLAMGLHATSGHFGAVLVEAPAGRSASEWADRLAEAGLIVRTPEGMGHTLGDRYIRVSIVEPKLMDKALKILRASL